VTSTRSGAAARRTRFLLPRPPQAGGARTPVQSAAGVPVFEVSAVAPDALVFAGPDGAERCTIHEATYGLQPLMRISRRGESVAWVRKEVVAPVGEHFAIDLGPVALSVRGSVADFEFTVNRGGRVIAAVSRVGTRPSGLCAVEVELGQDDALILAAVVCIALMAGGAG
jgi:uncharacterized protein YxjI